MTPADLDPKTLGRDHTCPACGATIPKGTNIDDANLRWYKAERSFGHKRPCPPAARASSSSSSQRPLESVPPPSQSQSARTPPSSEKGSAAPSADKPVGPGSAPGIRADPGATLDLAPSPGIAKWTASVEQPLTDDPAGPTFKLTAFDATSLGAVEGALPRMVAVARKAREAMREGGR